MKQNITIMAVLMGSLLISCKETPKETEASAVPETKTYSQLEKAEWFLGEWGNVTPEGELTERWKQENDSVYLGESYFVINGKDTVFAETVRLEEASGKLTYTVTVPGQNNGQPVPFKMTSATDSQLVFENPQHDFPSKIVYNKITADSIMAEISGMEKGKPASQQFAMKKR